MKTSKDPTATLLIGFLVCIAFLCFPGFMLVRHLDHLHQTDQESLPWCGTTNTAYPLPEYPEGGVELFEQCTACHAVGRKVVGPPLREVPEAGDQKWFADWVRGQARGERRLGRDDYESLMPCIIFDDLTRDETDLIYRYLKIQSEYLIDSY